MRCEIRSRFLPLDVQFQYHLLKSLCFSTKLLVSQPLNFCQQSARHICLGQFLGSVLSPVFCLSISLLIPHSFVMFLLLFALSLSCFSYSKFLRWEFRLLIWDFNSFLIHKSSVVYLLYLSIFLLTTLFLPPSHVSVVTSFLLRDFF